MNATQVPQWLVEAQRRGAEPCVVVLRNAVHSDGRKGDAYIGADNQFSTLDAATAQVFERFDADRFADHWRGWYHGFYGGARIDVVDAADLREIEARG